MIPKDGLDFPYVLAALKRRFWYIVIPFFLVAMASVVYCIKAPRIYRSTTLILIQPQEVPTDYVRSTVTSDVQYRLRSISEQIMSRSRLEELINRYDLYPEIRAGGDIPLAVDAMRKDIIIKFKENKDRRDSPPAFEVGFDSREPTKARDVAAALASIFLDQNLKIREEQAAGTSRFIERELERMREVLREKEKLVGDFRQKYRGLLPEQMENNYRILTQLQQHIDSLNDTLQKAKDRKVLLQTQLNRLDNLQVGDSTVRGKDQEPRTLDGLRQELQRLRLRYSDRHPDVIRLKTTVAKMEKEQEASLPDNDPEKPEPSATSTKAETLMRFQKEDSLSEISLVDKEIHSLSEEIKRTSDQIEEYRQRIERGPKIEQMFVDLKRDYDMASNNYQSLLAKKMQADLAQNLERTQKGEQFEILDPANLPRKPDKPDILKILAMGFALAAACGLGLAFVREYMDPTFWSKQELESFLGLPVLVSVPVIRSKKDLRWMKVKNVTTICALLIMGSSLLCALFLLWQKSPGLLPL